MPRIVSTQRQWRALQQCAYRFQRDAFAAQGDVIDRTAKDIALGIQQIHFDIGIHGHQMRKKRTGGCVVDQARLGGDVSREAQIHPLQDFVLVAFRCGITDP